MRPPGSVARASQLSSCSPGIGLQVKPGAAAQPLSRQEDDIDPFAPDEQAAILAKLAPQTANMIQFAFWAGLRSSELFALRWGDVDEKRSEIHVRRALTRAAKGKPEAIKAVADNRSVKLLRPALDALAAQRSHTTLAGAEISTDGCPRRIWAPEAELRSSLEMLPILT